MKNGATVYHCKRISGDNAEVALFDKPVSYILRPMYLTIQPNTGNVYDETFGEYKDYEEKMCASPYEMWDTEIKEGDVFYIDIGKPDGYDTGTEPEYGWGYDANFKVAKVAKQNRVIYYALKSKVEN